MKPYIAIAMMGLGLVISPAYAEGDHSGHGMNTSGGHMMDSAQMPMSEGTVKKVAKDTGKVTIAHGPLENMGMPGMTMVFRVKDAAWLDQMKPGDKIRFVADRVDGAITVIKYEPAK